jgi:hypothetical protein
MCRPPPPRPRWRRWHLGQRIGAEQIGAQRVVQHFQRGLDQRLARLGADRRLPRQPGLAASARAGGASAGRRSSRAWISVPRRAAAARVSSEGGSAPASSPSDEGASGRGGRASGRGAFQPARLAHLQPQFHRLGAPLRGRRQRADHRLRAPDRVLCQSSSSTISASLACQLPGAGIFSRWPSAPPQRLFRARHRHIEQAPVLLALGLAARAAAAAMGPTRLPSSAAARAGGARRRSARRLGSSSWRRQAPGRIARGIGQDHDRRLKPFRSMHRHHAHHAIGLARLALQLAITGGVEP